MLRLLPWVCLAGFLAAAWLVTLPTGLAPGSRLLQVEDVRGSLPELDQAWFLFALWWTPEALFHRGQHPWYCPLLGAPDGTPLLYTTLSPLLGIATWPLRPFLNGIAIYNLLVIVSIALAAFMTTLLVRILGGSRRGALLAGAILFYPPILQYQVSHLNILNAWWIIAVYACWALWRKTRRQRWAWATALTAAGLFYVSAYHTIHTALLLTLDGGWRFWLSRGQVARRYDRWSVGLFWGALLGAFIVLSWVDTFGFALLAISIGVPLAITLVDRLEAEGPRALLRGIPWLPLFGLAALVAPFFLVGALDERVGETQPRVDLQSKLHWSAQPLLYALTEGMCDSLTAQGRFGGDDMLKLSGEKEFRVFPGYAVWAVLGAVLLATRRRAGTPARWRWLAWAGVFVVLSFGPALRWGAEVYVPWSTTGLLVLPGSAFAAVPLLDGYRVFARLGLMALLCAAVFIGLSWETAVSRLRRNGLRWAVTAVLALLIVVERIDWPASVQHIDVPDFYHRLAEEPPGLRLFEFPENDWACLYPLTLHGHELVNYFTSRYIHRLHNRRGSNAFLYTTAQYGHPMPRKLGPPQVALTRAACRQGFAQLDIDGVLVHRDYLVTSSDEKMIRRLFEVDLGLDLVYESPRLLFYANPAAATRRDWTHLRNPREYQTGPAQ